LADTRGLQQDELHKQSIAAQIKKHVNSINTVLILANGIVPRVTVGTDYALSILSAMFSQTLTNNIAFIFTNVSGRRHWNFSKETVPDILKDAPHFTLNNPIALQRKYLRLMDDSSTANGRACFRRAVKDAEHETLGVLVDLFHWLDGLESQPTADNAPRYQNTLIPTSQAVANKAMGHTVSYSPSLHPHRRQLTLEQGYTSMGGKGDSHARQEKMRGSSEQVRGWLWLLKMAQEKVQGGVRKVVLYFTG